MLRSRVVWVVLFLVFGFGSSAYGQMFSVGSDSRLLSDLRTGVEGFQINASNVATVNAKFGFEVSPNLFILTGIDYASIGLTGEDTDSYDCEYYNECGTDESSLRLFTLELGAKSYLAARSASAVVPYAGALTTFYFPAGESNGEDVDFDDADLSVITLRPFYGVEYFFTERFSVGGEIGLDVLLLEANDSELSLYDVYSGFRLNYFL
jgi:hypothetical protein